MGVRAKTKCAPELEIRLAGMQLPYSAKGIMLTTESVQTYQVGHSTHQGLL